MKRYLALLPVMALMLGCGAKVTHFMIPEEQFYAQIKVIAFPHVEFNYEEVKDQSLINTITQEFEELILQKFSESQKFQIIPPSKCEDIQNLKCDGILYVSIDTVIAKVSKSKAKWDGITQSVETMGGHLKHAFGTAIFSLGSKEYVGLEGGCPALSLVAIIKDQGEDLWVGRGGIHILTISKAGGQETLPPEEALGKHKCNKRAIDIAFKSLLK